MMTCFKCNEEQFEYRLTSSLNLWVIVKDSNLEKISKTRINPLHTVAL